MLSPFHPIQLALGLAVWIIWFGTIYGGLSLGCVVAPPDPEQGPFTWINALLLLVTLAIAALLLNWARNCWRAAGRETGPDRSPRALIAHVAAGLHLTAAIATLAVGLTLLALPPCV